MDLTEKINTLLEHYFLTDPLFEDCFVIEVELKAKNKLEVFLDADTGISLAKCQKISRFIEAHLDENGWLGEKYTLEVSSPGLSRPLKVVRQYQKNIGRILEVKLKDDTQVSGILKEANETSFGLEIERVEREGKKKKKIVEILPFSYENIEKALVKPVFSKLKKK